MEAKRFEPESGADDPVAKIHFVVERGYEEALGLLWAARQRAPDVAEIVRGIQLIKQRLVRRYLCHLGDLDRVPRLLVDANALDELNLEAEELEIVRLVDGVSSYGDIVVESRFGRLETYRRLAELLARGIIVSDGVLVLADATPKPVVEEAEEEQVLVLDDDDLPRAAEPEVIAAEVRNHNVWWLVAALIVVAVGAGVMWWIESQPTAPPPTAALPAPQPVAAAPIVTAPEPPAETATPPAPTTAPNTATATATDSATDSAPAPATATVPAAAPTPAPAHRSHPKPSPPKTAHPATPPSRDVVDQTLARIEPAFRSCYADSRRTGPVRVSLTIDESGIAHDLETDPGSAPALADCVRGKSDRLHRGDAPAELGVARVSFTVTQ